MLRATVRNRIEYCILIVVIREVEWLFSQEHLPQPSWHGIPRKNIDWYPVIEPELCIGCGICVLGCGRQVFKFDYENNVPIVADALNCLVGCTTCENTCPQHAIGFPPMSYLHKIIKKRGVIQHSRTELMSNMQKYTGKKQLKT